MPRVQDINRYFSSRKGSDEMTRIATALGKFGAEQMRAIGGFIVDFAKGVYNLGKNLSGHNVDFGTFGDHLKKWGDAFLKWSQSESARKTVNHFLQWMSDNGKTVSSLLGSIAEVLPNLFTGLSKAGSIQLQALTGFFNMLAKLPDWLQQAIATGLPLFIVGSKVMPAISAASALRPPVIVD